MNVSVQFYANTYFSSLARLNVSVFLSLCFIVAFSEDGDDVTLQCPSKKHSIDIKEIKVEKGQVTAMLNIFKYPAMTP